MATEVAWTIAFASRMCCGATCGPRLGQCRERVAAFTPDGIVQPATGEAYSVRRWRARPSPNQDGAGRPALVST